MAFRNLPLNALVVNRANDRHGELIDETAAIAWLFNNREQHMRNLTRDLVQQGQIYELPLVWPDKGRFAIFDGNRRVTCLKLLAEPHRAPTVDLQAYFKEQRAKWKGNFPTTLYCQVETDRERIDEILYRRHTGSQNGVGQSPWDDRMKSNFVDRTGKGGGINTADEIEKRLASASLLPRRSKIPRSTLNRLLSSEAYRNRLGITVNRGNFEITHQEPIVLAALARVADDLANKRLTLNDVWDVDGKRAYLDQLEREGVLPTAAHTLAKSSAVSPRPATPKPKPSAPPKPTRRTNLIPQTQYGVAWPGRLQRHHMIWEELQFKLNLSDHPNAISVLFRVLLELSVENYIGQTKLATITDKDGLGKRVLRVAEDLHANGKIDKKYLGICQKMQQLDPLVSLDTLNRYVHSPNFSPSPDHLTTLWDTLSDFIVHCLSA